MKDSQITKKPRSSGSIAVRILSVSILLLVIPLFLQSLFLYRQEYAQKLKDVESDLRMLAQERADLIEEIIHMDWALLDSWDSPHILGIRGGPVERIPEPPDVGEHFLVVSRSREALLVGKKEQGNMALVVPVPFQVIGRDLPRAFPVHISLISGKGRVLWENGPKLEASDLLQVQDSILGTDFSIRLGVSKNAVHGLHLESYYFRFGSLVFFVGVIGGLAVYLLTRRISRPLKNLVKTMQRVSEGASHARYTPDRMGFEINALGIQFNETLDSLLKHAQEVEKERIGREKLAKEFHIGHEIQANLLPKHLPGLPGIDIASRYFASKEVNGDFYDLFRLKNGKLLIAVCDIAGKGIQACLFSLGLRSIIRSVASMTSNLSQIVMRANDLYLIDAHESSMFATLWIGIFDPKSKKLTYCSQGHPPALLIREGDVQELWTEGIAMGAQTLDVVTVDEIKLKKEDSLVLYTDGVIEAHDSANQLFGKERLNALFSEIRTETADQMAGRIIENVHLFVKGARQHDDITLLIMHLLNSRPPQ